MNKVIKTYEEFAPKPNPLLLPSHEEGGSDMKLIFFLNTIYQMNNYDIEKTAEQLNKFYDKGYYVKIKHLKSGIELIKHNEPCEISGSKAGTITKSGIDVYRDSIVIEVKHDDSTFILSIDDDYQITFQKPKVVVSKHDPYGEEDWTYDD